LIYVSGQVPKAASGEMVHPGKLGENLSVQQGQEAARQAALNALALVKAAAGSLEAVNRIVHVTVHVASAPDFHEQHVVANGASDFLLKVFGDVGRHSRAALGAVSLPINASIELEMLVEV
jgi:enamine deaminase RidA (YjgF/YER057c/UK114 family)